MGNGKGFASHPENINRNGRPKKGDSIADAMRELMEEKQLVTITASDGNQKQELLSRKKAFCMRVYEIAMGGNMTAAKMCVQLTDGFDEGNGGDDPGEWEKRLRAAGETSIYKMIQGIEEHKRNNPDSDLKVDWEVLKEPEDD